jgi:hypothetical protein
VKKVENQVQNARNRAKKSVNKLLTRFIYPQAKVCYSMQTKDK